MDALKLLETQHRELERLLVEFRRADSGAGQSDVFGNLSELLEAHITLAEKLLYPELLDEEMRRKLEISEALQLRMKRLLGEMVYANTQDARFGALFDALERDLRAHIRLEEEELFQAAYDSRGRRALQRLGEEMTTLNQLLGEGLRI
jgi:hypothetical protein